MTVISGVVHVVIPQGVCCGAEKNRGQKKQNPRSGGRPGVENSLVGDPSNWAPYGYQARQWLNQYPK
ncbi:hypothetical protein GIW70_08995 [Pseudomonas syringae]|nr:hypothetical protein [Pseudomonas syringae]MCF5068331.1 hypothetical protein [Pseudomonas syringae]